MNTNPKCNSVHRVSDLVSYQDGSVVSMEVLRKS